MTMNNLRIKKYRDNLPTKILRNLNYNHLEKIVDELVTDYTQ